MAKRTDGISSQDAERRRESSHRKSNRLATSKELGQSLIVFVLFLAAACGFVGLVSDVGFMMHERAALQAGVDSAALAGASALPGEEEATSIATEFAAANGLTEPGVVLTINTPYNGDPTKIEVIATSTRGSAFLGVLGTDIFDVSARAVGTIQAGGREAAMLSLNPTQCDSFNKGGSSNITINNDGGIMINSSCDPSIDVNGIGTVTAAIINYYHPGGFQQSGSQLNPTPVPVQLPLTDPLKNVPPPNLSTMSVSPNSGGTALNPAMNTVSSGTVTLNPGIYYGGLTIKSNANVTLQPGVYVMAGGGFTVMAGSPTISGSEVMIYSTFDPQQPTAAGACASIDLSGDGTWSYSPPTSGLYKGIGLWQDEACTNNVKINGSNGGPSGAIYAPKATVKMAGSGSVGSIQLIADSFNITGSGDISVDFVPFISIPLDPSVSLAE